MPTAARVCGKGHVRNLEPDDLVALTVEAVAMAGVPPAGTDRIPGRHQADIGAASLRKRNGETAFIASLLCAGSRNPEPCRHRRIPVGQPRPRPALDRNETASRNRGR